MTTVAGYANRQLIGRAILWPSTFIFFCYILLLHRVAAVYFVISYLCMYVGAHIDHFILCCVNVL